MTVQCYMRDYRLSAENRFNDIFNDIKSICQVASVDIESIIGLCTFDYENDCLHYGFVVNSDLSDLAFRLAELGLRQVYATVPDTNWEVFAGNTADLPCIYRTALIMRKVSSAMEFFYSNETCKVFMQ